MNQKTTRRRLFAAFFVAALLVRLAVAAKYDVFHWFGRSEVEVIALNVVQQSDYTLYGAPSAYATPVFPLFLAGLFSIFGTGLLCKVVCVALASTVSALRCAFVPLFAMDAGLDSKIGILAGCLSVIYVAPLETELSGNVDGPYVALALLILIWTLMRLWKDGSWQTRNFWWFYVFCGFSVLLNPSLLPVMAALFLVGAIACPPKARGRYLGQVALAALGILLFLAPWVIRNEITLGAPILTRSNFGTEFWVSNGPDRTFNHPHNYHLYHPSQNREEADKVNELGEPEYNRMKFAAGMTWVRANPASFLRLLAERIAAWWFPPQPLFALAPKAILTLLAFAGLWLLFKRQSVVAWLFLTTWITYPAVYYLVHWSSRYRAPMDWQILLCASVALLEGWRAAVGSVVGSRRPATSDVTATS
jgi:hypothetical protein